MSIEAYVTQLDGTYVGHLERSPTSLIRGVQFSIELNKPGAAVFEYHRESAAIVANPALVALDNLLWVRYRNVTRVYVLEQRTMQFDQGEQATGWYKVAGRGVLVLLDDRLVWPDGFTGTEQPDTWTDQWRTIVSTPAGEMLWELIDETNARFSTQITAGTIETVAGDEWTQQFRFDTLLDVVGQATQALGDVDMDGLEFNYYNAIGTNRSATVILEEGADVLRATRDTSRQGNYSWIVAEGVGEGVFAKVAVAEDTSATRRREAYLDAKDAGNLELLQIKVAGALDELSGETDRIGFDLLEQGTGSSRAVSLDGRYQALRDFSVGDWLRIIAPSVDLDDSIRVVALYFAEDGDEVRVSIDVNDQRTEYLLDLEEGNETNARSIGVRNRQPQGQLVPYALGPWTGPFDDTVAAEFYFELPARIFLLLEVILNIRLREFQATSRAAAGNTSGASSASTTVAGGGQTTSNSAAASSASTTVAGGGQTTSNSAAASSKSTADAGGGQTTSNSAAASSTSTSGNGADHQHAWGARGGAAAGHTLANYSEGGGSQDFDLHAPSGSTLLRTSSAGSDHSHGIAHTHAHDHTVSDHSHGMAHTHAHDHTVSDHSHGMAHDHPVPQLDLVYGMYEESMPASWSVTPHLYTVSAGGSLSLVHTFDPITSSTERLDMTEWVTDSGGWMVRLISDAAQPNDGRLLADIYGAIVGAISSAR